MCGSKEDKTSLAWVVKELSSSKYGPECNQDPWPVELVCCLMSGQSQRLARCWQSALKCFRYLGSPTVTGVVDTGLLYSQVVARVCLQPNLQTVWFQLANTSATQATKSFVKWKNSLKSVVVLLSSSVQTWPLQWGSGNSARSCAPVRQRTFRYWYPSIF